MDLLCLGKSWAIQKSGRISKFNFGTIVALPLISNIFVLTQETAQNLRFAEIFIASIVALNRH